MTDDKTCLKFMSDQHQDLNKMAKLNTLMMGLCAHGPTGTITITITIIITITITIIIIF